jgi:hypothetical protein
MNILKLSIITFSVLLSTNALSQTPQKDEGPMKILCVNKVDQREIFYDENKDAWCDTTMTNFCSLSQRKAVKKVCSKVYKSRLAQFDTNEKPKPIAVPKKKVNIKKAQESSVLEQEQMDIELRKIEIDQRKLDVRKQELELLKQDQ